MGFMVMDETFDTWRGNKRPNDYGGIFPVCMSRHADAGAARPQSSERGSVERGQ